MRQGIAVRVRRSFSERKAILFSIDPLATGLVLGGSLFAAALRATRAEIAGAVAALGPFLRADPRADGDAARRAVQRMERLVETKDLVCVDRIATTGRFLGEAGRRLSDARTSAEFAAWAEETLEARRCRHAGVVAVWRGIADAAPGMGMIATVIGLIAMFRAMDDPAAIGAPMASALAATLTGLVIAHLVAGPIADRLERLSAAELAWQRRTADHLLALARAELDHAVGLQRTLARRVA